MQKYTDDDKRMTSKEAIKRFVNDNDSFVFANCLYSMPLALTHELIRQEKKNLMVFQQGGIDEVDQLLEARLIDRAVIAYDLRMGGKRFVAPIDRAMKEGGVKVEGMSHFSLLSMMKAGAMGYPFIPVLSGIRRTDVVQRQGFLEDQRFGEVEDPFSGNKILVVKGYNPDFALMHVQRADKAGNAQLCGAMINSKWAALASKKVIISAEKIVSTEVIMSSPHLTIVPAHKVCAVVECPWGAHPSELAGHYDNDMVFRALYFASIGAEDSFKTWLDEWVYGMSDRREYMEHYIDTFGVDTLDALKAKPFPSVPADYGFSFSRTWDDAGNSEQLGMNMEEFVKMLEEKGGMVNG
ncbi:MAG: hypothetical protein K8S18_15345 [Desulfobacula sp.]|nr:hypothetical protein [Desulfobacula sp.]